MDIAVLFVRADSIYKTIPGCDCYDAERDALTWPGGMPVIAHPPCRTWGRLKAFATAAPEGEHALGLWAISQVRKWGGVADAGHQEPNRSDNSVWCETCTALQIRGE